MKKIIYSLLLGILALTTSCEPQELVHSDAEISKIITILHDGMGQPASVCLEQFEKMGITIPLVQSEETKEYILRNSKMWLGVTEKNDSVIYARYELYTTNTYAEGINDFIDFDNVVYNQKWEKWEGGLDNDVTDLTQHETANKEIAEMATTYNQHQLSLSSFYEKRMGNLYMHAETRYWGVAVGGMNLETGEAIGSKIKSEIRLFLRLDKNAQIKD